MSIEERLREHRGAALLAVALAAVAAAALWGPRGAVDNAIAWAPPLSIGLAALAVFYAPWRGPGR